MLLLEYKPLKWHLNITFQSAALRWTHFAGAKCTYIKTPFFYSKGYVLLDTGKSLQTAPMILASGTTNRQYISSTWLVFKR